MRFRYSYLYRLIDDNELRGLSPAVRTEIRKVHKQAYWKNLCLLRRDAARVLRLRRGMMAARRYWDFSALVNGDNIYRIGNPGEGTSTIYPPSYPPFTSNFPMPKPLRPSGMLTSSEWLAGAHPRRSSRGAYRR